MRRTISFADQRVGAGALALDGAHVLGSSVRTKPHEPFGPRSSDTLARGALIAARQWSELLGTGTAHGRRRHPEPQCRPNTCRLPSSMNTDFTSV